jgi:hypothetical protein
MKKRASKPQFNPVKKHSWRTLIGALTVTILLVGVVSAISTRSELPILKAQDVERKADVSRKSGDTPEAAGQRSRNYVTSNAAGQTVVLDRQTGQTRPLSPDETRTLAEGIKQLVKPTAEGLVQVQQANGMVSMDLQGHFQNVTVAKIEADGSVSQSCVNDLESAADFFEIDPVLLGVAAPVSKSEPSSTKLPIR